MAPRLIEAGVGSVLAISYAVHVEAAKILVERFYAELVKGKTVGEALGHGRKALQAQTERWIEPGPTGRKIPLEDWFLPQLYQGGRDLSLVARGGRASARPPKMQKPLPQGQQPGAFPHPPLYAFQGRARELNRLVRAFRHERAVLLHAMGGMGKTALGREAAHWLTRVGVFPVGACFVSFEQPTTAEQVASLLGTYLEGESFDARREDEQLERAQHHPPQEEREDGHPQANLPHLQQGRSLRAGPLDANRPHAQSGSRKKREVELAQLHRAV